MTSVSNHQRFTSFFKTQEKFFQSRQRNIFSFYRFTWKLPHESFFSDLRFHSTCFRSNKPWNTFSCAKEKMIKMWIKAFFMANICESSTENPTMPDQQLLIVRSFNFTKLWYFTNKKAFVMQNKIPRQASFNFNGESSSLIPFSFVFGL